MEFETAAEAGEALSEPAAAGASAELVGLSQVEGAPIAALAVGLLVVILIFVALARRSKPRAGGEAVAGPVRRVDPAAAFRFAVGRFSGDTGALADRIAAALAAAFPDAVIDRVRFAAPVEGEDARARGAREAAKRGATALIWGALSEDGATVIARASPMGGGLSDPAARASLDPAAMPLSDDAAFAAAAAALVAACGRPVEAARDRYVEFVLAPAVARLRVYAAPPPPAWSGLDRARQRQVYALAAMRSYDETGDADDLDAAVAAADAAVCDGRRPRAPLEWAAAEAIRGRALAARAARDGDAAAMLEAAKAFDNAILGPAPARGELALAHLTLAFCEAVAAAADADPGVARLDAASARLGEASARFAASGDDEAGARARAARGRLLLLAGRRAGGARRLDDAVAAFRDALEADDLDSSARAALTLELAEALRLLGARESGAARLRESVAAYREALDGRTREDAPLAWARVQHGLGAALEAVGEREAGAAGLADAVAALRAALMAYDEAGAGEAAARARRDLSRAERLLAERRAAAG